VGKGCVAGRAEPLRGAGFCGHDAGTGGTLRCQDFALLLRRLVHLEVKFHPISNSHNFTTIRIIAIPTIAFESSLLICLKHIHKPPALSVRDPRAGYERTRVALKC
jgi:hypothetical protein